MLMNINNKYTLREIDGLWGAVDSACQTPPTLADFLNMCPKIKPNIYGQKHICKYTIYRDNKTIEKDILGYRTALAHARKWQYDLFENFRKIEILNQWTGEIISIEEAERRVKQMHKD